MTGRNPLDLTGPSIAGVYDYLLGGRDNFAADRRLGDELTGICKIAADLAAENRAFLTRAVTWAAEAGIGQYLDLGAGFPVSPVTHEPARAVVPAARVAYVDADPVVIAHARALLTGPGITAHGIDLRDADGVLGECEAAGWDLAEPACVLLGAVLHFLHAQEAREVVARYVRRLAPESAVVVSVWGTDDPELAAGDHRRVHPGEAAEPPAARGLQVVRRP